MELKMVDKSFYKSLNKKGLVRKGDFTKIAELCNKTRQHISIVMKEQGSTTQDVVDCIVSFYDERVTEMKGVGVDVINKI